MVLVRPSRFPCRYEGTRIFKTTRTVSSACRYQHCLAKKKGRRKLLQRPSSNLAPQVGLEPTTLRLTAKFLL